jgi:2-keto-4-pentenoate hydratase
VLENLPTADRIAASFVAARASGRALTAYPGEIPRRLGEAYAVQDAAIARRAGRIGGWKVGRVLPPHSMQFGVDRLVGPIFASSIVDDDGSAPAVGRVFDGGFGAAEAEFLLQLAERPPAGQALFTLDEAAALVGAVHVGIEIASSPFAGINDYGPAVIISDFGNNNGLVVGAAIANWRSLDFSEWSVATFIDGSEAGRGTAAAFPDGPLGSARFLLQQAAARGIVLEAGTWISSGAVSGVHEVRPGQFVEARFAAASIVRCTIEAVPRS